MDNTSKFIAKLSAIWASIGLFLTATGITGNSPSWLVDIFSQGFVDALTTFVGATLTFWQFVRVIFAAKASSAISTLSASDKFAYLNPFKV